jgi:Site-specific recombinase XerD
MKKNEAITIIAMFDKYNIGEYKVVRNYVADFINQRYGKTDCSLLEVDIHFITGFEHYLMKYRNCNVNTVAKHMESLRCIINVAYKKYAIVNNPFSQIVIKNQEPIRESLTESELQVVVHQKLPKKSMEQVRDVFIFSCFTGLLYSDLSILTSGHIHHNEKGNLPSIVINRQKTGIQVNVPLLQVPLNIIDKYKGMYGKLLPITNIQKTNIYLKEIRTLCGINKSLSFSVARNTFVSTITYSNGISLDVISKMLGHININTVRVYLPKDAKRVYDMQDMSEKLANLDNNLLTLLTL